MGALMGALMGVLMGALMGALMGGCMGAPCAWVMGCPPLLDLKSEPTGPGESRPSGLLLKLADFALKAWRRQILSRKIANWFQHEFHAELQIGTESSTGKCQLESRFAMGNRTATVVRNASQLAPNVCGTNAPDIPGQGPGRGH